MAGKIPADYDRNVFINCPFDEEYKPMFEAAVFAIISCGYSPRCALEISDASEVRIDKINKIIETCRFAIHDISRTGLDKASQLPRFNMPLELGLFLGCKRFGGSHHKKKSCIIFDLEAFRFQKFMSDIAGQDISAHGDDQSILIRKIRNWLMSQNQGFILPGGAILYSRYRLYAQALPKICKRLKLDQSKLEFIDLVHTVRVAASFKKA